MSLVCTLSPEPIGGGGGIVFLRKHSFHFYLFYKFPYGRNLTVMQYLGTLNIANSHTQQENEN